ncbi:trypsin-like serine peptidase [Brachybacterium squillarum]|uniref:trypsin-like serine peptidase n=1 Tax=Brachybacterium squillarum TaxID=661979 RepID=UPI002223C510|nr:serine protease [Brachybacterium squillarum]MCW1805359.1 serine protease [Brachybacterium squillarum]
MTQRPLLRRCSRLLGGAALVAGLAVGGAGIAAADGPDSERTTLSSSAQSDAHEYWTASRMESAVPAEDLAPEDSPVTDAVEKGKPQTVTGRSAEKGKKPQAAAAAKDTVGKVFFTQGGVDYVCSGNAVASGNGSTVATAGHCVNDAGTWATNWVFVPGYDHGDAPYGTWVATDLVSTDQWVSDEDISYDVAFAKVEPESGTATLESTVGTTAIAFNQARGASYTSYGYPAAAPFDGESLESCSGTASDDTIGDTQSQGISCDMTGGSSGGPWFLGDGAQNSVNSFGYNTQKNVMYGPYFGADAQSAYAEAGAL